MLTWITLAALGAGSGALLVQLNPPEDPPAELSRISEVRSVGPTAVLDLRETLKRLTGLKAPRNAKAEGFQAMLAEADRLEARFETANANAMRVEILRSYDDAARITPILLLATARAAQDRAASALNEKQLEAARALALETTRRFGDIDVDEKRHKPAVRKMFERARERNASAPTGALRVTGTGTLHADGRELGSVDGEARFALPIGHYRVWLESPAGLSFAREVNISSDAEAAVAFDLELEHRFSLEPPRLQCEPERCPALLERLRTATQTRVVVGLAVEDDALVAWRAEEGSDVERMEPARLLIEERPAKAREFSALYLVPLGVGQAAQERYVAAGIYGAVQLGLGAWNIATARQASDAREAGDPGLSALQDRQDLSAILFYSALTASVIESVLVWSLSD